jgi:two-component system KDP operon response regulator KdpE
MTEKKETILVIEDETSLRRFLKASLTNESFKVVETDKGEEGLALAASHRAQLILLDLGLPDMDGLEVLKRLRKTSLVPVIILTARGKDGDKIAGLDAGADDYLTKPFSVGELLARIRVALRHAQKTKGEDAPAIFESRGLKVDLTKRLVLVKNKPVHLTPNEYDVLALLVRYAGKVVTQKQILTEIWGNSNDSQNLRTYIHQLREKIEPDPNRPQHLITEQGVGYRLKDE